MTKKKSGRNIGDECPGSVSGHDGNTLSGKCRWCSAQIQPPQPAPKKLSQPTKLDTEYRRTYDPDFGNRKDDV